MKPPNVELYAMFLEDCAARSDRNKLARAHVRLTDLIEAVTFGGTHNRIPGMVVHLRITILTHLAVATDQRLTAVNRRLGGYVSSAMKNEAAAETRLRKATAAAIRMQEILP